MQEKERRGRVRANRNHTRTEVRTSKGVTTVVADMLSLLVCVLCLLLPGKDGFVPKHVTLNTGDFNFADFQVRTWLPLLVVARR